MAKYTEGEIYFRLVYPDPDLLYPEIESFVYIGMNLSDEDSEDTWYFQFSNDYAKNGSFLESKLGDCKVCCLTSNELSSMFNLTELKEQLAMAELRREQLRCRKS